MISGIPDSRHTEGYVKKMCVCRQVLLTGQSGGNPQLEEQLLLLQLQAEQKNYKLELK